MAPDLTISDASQPEGNARFDPNIEFVVTLSEAATTPVTFTLNTISASAPEGFDFQERFDDPFTIPAGTVTQVIAVDPFGDTAVEGDEGFFLELSNLSGATFDGDALTARALGILTDDDGDNRPALFVKDVRLVEGNSGAREAVFEIALSRGFAFPVSFAFETVGVTAEAGSDFTAQSGTVDFAANTTTATVSVPILTDTAIEGTESFDLVLDTAGVDLASPVETTVGTATILDDDAAAGFQPVISISDGRQREGDDRFDPGAEFTISLSQPSANPITYRAETISGSAEEGFDFEELGGTFTIPAGITTQTFFVDTVADGFDEGDHAFTLRLSNADGAVFAGGARALNATGFLRDDDGDVRPTLAVKDVEVVERNGGAPAAVFEIGLSRPFDTDISIPFETLADSATAGEDFTARTGTVAFAAGQTDASLTVSLLPDSNVEQSETFDLVLDTSTLDLANRLERTVGTATILDDDAGGGTLPVLSLDHARQREGNDRFDPGVEFIASLSAPAPGPITFSLETISLSADEGFDFDEFLIQPSSQPVVIPAGQTSTTLFVDTFADGAAEGDEAFVLKASDLSGAVFEGGRLSVEALGILEDDDGDGRIGLFVESATVAEGDAGIREITVDVLLSRAQASPLSVPYTTAPRGADAGDILGDSGVLTFAPGQTRKSVTLGILGDTDAEGTEFVDIVLSRPDGGEFVEGGTGTRGTVTILDDDSGLIGQPVLSIADARQREGDGSFDPGIEFILSLSEPAPGDITYTATTTSGTAAEGDDFGARASSFTFPAGSTTQTFAVDVFADGTAEDDETFFLDISNVSGAALEGGASTLRATGTILDDDSGAAVLPALIVEDVSVAEPAAGQTTATFTIASPVPAGLTIQGDFEVVGGTAEAGSDFLAQSGSFTIPGGSFTTSVSVPILADNVAEGDETLVLRLSDIQNAGSGNQAGEVHAIATIADSAEPGPQLSLSAVDADTFEGDLFETPFSFRLDRSGGFGTGFSVDFEVTGSGADPAEPEDFPGGVFPSGTIDISASSSVQGFTIGVAPDTVIEGDEGFTLTLSNPTNGAVITQATATGVIRDDDANLDPVAEGDAAGTAPGAPVLIDVLANDADPLGDPLSIAGAGTPSGGTAAVEGGGIRYTPDPGFVGMDSFIYDVADGNGGTASALVTVRVGEPALQDGVLRASDRDDPIVIGQNLTYLGNAGRDTYVLSAAALPERLSIIEDRGENVLQLVDGLDLAAVAVQETALQIDLLNGARVRLLGADSFLFDVGGNATAGTQGAVLGFGDFVTGVLGLAVPGPGGAAVAGPLTIGADPAALAAAEPVAEDGFLA